GGDATPSMIPGSEQPEEEDRKPVVHRAGKLPKELRAWFKELETDGDGQIGLYEWKASGRPLDEFMKMDRNGDGFLTVEEVLRSVAAAKPQTGDSQTTGGN